MSYIVNSHGYEDTFAIGRSFGSYCECGLIFLLDGDLAAGKTVFAKGLGMGLGVRGYIKSPSYTLMCSYEGSLPFYHFDAYHLNGIEDFYALGFDEFLEDGVALIEWASVIKEDFPYAFIHLDMAAGEGENDRILTFSAHGDRCKEILEDWWNHEDLGF